MPGRSPKRRPVRRSQHQAPRGLVQRGIRARCDVPPPDHARRTPPRRATPGAPLWSPRRATVACRTPAPGGRCSSMLQAAARTRWTMSRAPRRGFRIPPKGSAQPTCCREGSRPPWSTRPGLPSRRFGEPKLSRRATTGSGDLASCHGCRSSHGVRRRRARSSTEAGVRTPGLTALIAEAVRAAGPGPPVSTAFPGSLDGAAEAASSRAPLGDRRVRSRARSRAVRRSGLCGSSCHDRFARCRVWLVGTRLDAPTPPPRMKTTSFGASTGSSICPPPQIGSSERGDVPPGRPKLTWKLGRSPELSFPFSASSVGEPRCRALGGRPPGPRSTGFASPGRRHLQVFATSWRLALSHAVQVCFAL